MNIEEQQNVTSYQEIFCDAVETIVAKRLTELKFDKTIQCTIIDDSNKDNGKYTVSDGTLKFEAYSDNKKLRKDDQVYVRIPGNDYSQKKDIVSVVEPSETEVKKVYVAPLDQIIPVEKEIFASKKEISLNVYNNGENPKEVLVENYEINYSYGFIDAIGIKAEFKTPFIFTKPKTGVYGLKIKLFDINDSLIEELDFNSETFFGNSYTFASYSPQQYLFIFNKGINLSRAECYFYSDQNFGVAEINSKDYSEQIHVQNIQLIFGYNTRNLDNDIVKIYGSVSTDEAYEKRTEINLGLIWNRKDDYERYLKMPKDTKIEIFKENIVGVGEKIYESTLEEERTDAILLSKVFSAEGKNLLALEPDYFQTKFYAKITCDGQTYISNILEYKNIKAPAQEVPKPEIGLEIVNKEDGITKSYYPIYDSSGLLDGVAPIGTLKLKYISSDSSKNYTADFFDGCVLRWMLPKNGTMLRWVKDAPMAEDNGAENYYHIDQKVSANEGDTIFDKEFQYTVSEYYDSGFLNNVIKCIVYRDEEPILQAEKIIYFSDIETQGSGYRLVVRGGENLKEPIVLSIYDNQGNEFIDKIEPNDIDCDIIFGAYDIASLNNSGLEGPLFRVEDKQIKPVKVEQYVSDSDIQPIIVKISVSFTTNSGKKTLSKLYPIECFSGESRPIKQAPSKITYDNSGTKVFGNDLRLIPNEKDRWTIKYYKDSIITKPEDTNSNFNLLQIVEDNEDLIIVPAPFYMELPSNIVPVLMYENDDNKWCRPILVEQDVYGSPVLNQWDGKFSINEDEGTVMAAALAVGKKNYENRFNGVLVGQVDKIDSSNNFGSAGLYGYDKGAQVFGINTDGKAFLGASGNGRLWVDGESGYIASASWMKGNNLLENLPEGASGTKIDLKSGEMQMVNGGGKGYLKFTEKDGLQVKADKFSLTSGTLGGYNLLKNTTPIEKKDDENKAYIPDWEILDAAGSIVLEEDKIKKKKSLKITSDDKALLYRIISQSIELKPNTEYTVSGEYKVSSTNIIPVVGFDDGMIEIVSIDENISEKFIPFILQLVSDKENSKFKIGMKLPSDNGGYKDEFISFHHLKLEEGSIATGWVANESDTQAQFDITNKSIEAKVSNQQTGSQCSWLIYSDGFYIAQGNTGKASANNYVLKVDSSGLAVKGGGEFSGAIKGGTIEIGGTTSAPNFKVDSSGNVTLNGNITWGISASPTQVVYASYTAENKVPVKPTDGKSYSSFEANATTAGQWHRQFNSSKDYFGSYTYDGGKTWGNPIVIKGKDGDPGSAGKGVSAVTNYYLATNSSTGVTISTSGWKTEIQQISSSKKYLWNYEVVTYTDSSTSKTEPTIIGAYGDTGATGRGIKTITETYMATNSGTTKPAENSTNWKSTIPSLSDDLAYLWCKEVITYDSGSPQTFIKLIAQKGNDGDDASVNKDNVFAALTNNGTSKGTFTDVNGELYINADYINTGTLRVGASGSEIFKADITNNTVKIGGWTVDQKGLYYTTNPNHTSGPMADPKIALLPSGGQGYTVCGTWGKNWVMVAGGWRAESGQNKSGHNFGITSDGKLYAQDVVLTGTITATDGKIGNWEIGTGIEQVNEYTQGSVVTQNGNQKYEYLIKVKNLKITPSGISYDVKLVADSVVSNRMADYASVRDMEFDLDAKVGTLTNKSFTWTRLCALVSQVKNSQ